MGDLQRTKRSLKCINSKYLIENYSRISVIQPFDNPVGTSNNPTILAFIYLANSHKITIINKKSRGVVLKTKLIKNNTDYLISFQFSIQIGVRTKFPILANQVVALNIFRHLLY